MKKLLASVATLLLAELSGAAGAEYIGTALPKSGEPGYSVDFVSTDGPGTYVLGHSLTSIAYNFELGSVFFGTLYDCDTANYVLETCDVLAGLSVDSSGTKITHRRWLVVVITGAEDVGFVSTLVVKGAYSVGSGSGGGGALDDFTTPVICASNIAPIDATTANYQITTGCATDDTIVVADVGPLDAAAIKTMSVINDSGFQLLLDVSANTGGATIESGSSIVPAGSTIAIVQTGDSTVHVIGTGGDLIVSHTAGTTDAIAFDGCLSKLHAVSTTGGSNLTLFDIVSPVGYKCYFLDIDASGFTVTPHSSDIIVLDGFVGTVGKGITNTAAPAIGDYFVLIAATSTKWFVESRTGTWVAVP